MLRSIYDGDDCFKEIGPTTFQYRVRLGLGGNLAASSAAIVLSWHVTIT